eukprot:UN26081
MRNRSSSLSIAKLPMNNNLNIDSRPRGKSISVRREPNKYQREFSGNESLVDGPTTNILRKRSRRNSPHAGKQRNINTHTKYNN